MLLDISSSISLDTTWHTDHKTDKLGYALNWSILAFNSTCLHTGSGWQSVTVEYGIIIIIIWGKGRQQLLIEPTVTNLDKLQFTQLQMFCELV